MTLRQFLAVMSMNKGTQVTLQDLEENQLLTFNIEGYETVEGDVLARVVKKALVTTKAPGSSVIAIKVILYDAPGGTSEG